MEQLLNDLLEKAKTDKKSLNMLKTTAIRCQQFELAAQLRELETSIFPESEEEKEAKNINVVLRMVELNVPNDICWLINETLKTYSKMKGKFSIKEATELIHKRKELFFDSELGLK